MPIKSLLLTLLLPALLTFSLTCQAGFAEGEAAVRAGDYATALHELQPLAGQGNAQAQNELGVMYERGNGVTQNYSQAPQGLRLTC